MQNKLTDRKIRETVVTIVICTLLIIVVCLIGRAVSKSVDMKTVSASSIENMEDVLYGEWIYSSDDMFMYDTWNEITSENNLIGADNYNITSVQKDTEENIVILYTTDYMSARIVLFKEFNYGTLEANYFVDDTNDYNSDTLYGKRKDT